MKICEGIDNGKTIHLSLMQTKAEGIPEELYFLRRSRYMRTPLFNFFV